MKESHYILKELSPHLWNDFVAFFEFKGECSGCWCMNHRLPVGLDFEGEAAKLAMRELVMSKRVFGLLAYVPGDITPIGWCALDRRRTLVGHDCVIDSLNQDSDVWSLHCLVSRSDFKGRGVEEFLAKESIKYVKTLGGKKLEAYPEPNSKPSRFKSWNTFSGDEETLRSLGLEAINDPGNSSESSYRVMSIDLVP